MSFFVFWIMSKKKNKLPVPCKKNSTFFEKNTLCKVSIILFWYGLLWLLRLLVEQATYGWTRLIQSLSTQSNDGDTSLCFILHLFLLEWGLTHLSLSSLSTSSYGSVLSALQRSQDSGWSHFHKCICGKQHSVLRGYTCLEGICAHHRSLP